MPDFDKNLQSIIKDTALPMERIDLTEATPAPRIDVGRSDFGDTTLQRNATDDSSDILANLSKNANFQEKGKFVTDAVLKSNQRYEKFNPIVSNQEDYASYNQSVLSKGVNGILKGTNLAATTIAGGFAMLGGTVSAAFTGRLADIWDNEGLRNLDKWNNKVDQEYLPNYYSNVEKEAAWYSTDNWMTANFLFDKLIKNSGYAVGAMVGGNIANAAVSVAGKGLGKVAGALAARTAASSSQAFKLFTPILRNSARAFSSAKNIEAAAILEKEISSIADITTRSSKLAELAKTTNVFAKINDTARRTAVAAYSSSGEASFEALQTAQEFREKLIEEYKSKNYGEEPIGADLENINMQAEKVGKTSFFGNLALLSVTEFAQLPYLMGSSYRSSKQAANSLMGQTDDVLLKGGVYSAKVPTTKFGKLYQKTKKVGQYIFDPKEAGQEIGQYALQVGTNNYFNKSRESNDADVLTDGFLFGLFGKDQTGKDVGALVSKEGIEGGILGGITGGLMQAKGNYLQDKSVATNTQQFVESLNSTPSFKEAFIDRLAAVNRGVTLQKQQQDAIVSGDELESKDLKADLVHNYLTPRIKYGRYDMIMEDFAELKQTGATLQGLASLKEQGLANINDTPFSFQQRITTLETTAKNTEQLYKAINLRYSGEILTDAEGMPVLSPEGAQLRKYSDEVIDKLVYASSKIADYDVRIPQVNSGLSQAGVATMDVLEGIIADGKPNKIATEEALSQINKLDVTSDVKDVLKTQLSDVIELSLRRKLFIEEYDDIKKNPLNYTYGRGYGADEKIDKSPVVVEQREKLEGEKRSKIVNTELEIGKEYSLKEPIRKEGTELQLAPKITILSKTLGGEFEVRLPNGKIKFLTPTEFRNYNIIDKDNSSEEFSEVLNKVIDTVLSNPEYSEIANIDLAPGETKLDFINALDNQALIDAVEKEFDNQTKELIKLREEEEAKKQKLLKNSEQITKEQTELQLNSGTISTPNTSEVEFTGEEGKLKDSAIFFLSGVAENENENDPTKSPAYTKRSIEFLNNVNNFPNRGQMKAILVTPNQMADLGLTGLAQMSYNVLPSTPLEDIPDVLDIDNGLIAQVFVVQQGKDLFFVDKEGKPLTKVGEQVDLDQVIFKRMPTTKTTDGSGRPRYRSDQKEEFEAAAKGWRQLREQLFSAPANIATSYSFDVSRGIPIEIKDGEGRTEKNQVGGILVPENKISTQEGLIIIPTTGSVVHKGQILKYPNGVPVLQYGDTLQFLNNKKFDSREAKGIFQVIKNLAEEMVAQSEAGKTIKINREYSYFLQNLLFWKDKAGVMGDNQIRINVDNLAIDLGKESYSLTEIAQKETQIVNQLQEIYNNVNSETLKKRFNEPFTEFYITKDGEFTTSEWTNYQTYLLSASYPSGSARPSSENPLSTTVAKSTPSVPYSFTQKYATLEGLELPVVKVVPKPAPVAPIVPVVTKTKIGEYTLDELNTYALQNGTVEFTPTQSPEGVVSVTVNSNETIKTIANNEQLVNNTIIPSLKKLDRFNATASNEELVLDFISLRIAGDLQKQKDAQVPAAPVEAPAPVVEVPEAPKSTPVSTENIPNYFTLENLSYSKNTDDNFKTFYYIASPFNSKLSWDETKVKYVITADEYNKAYARSLEENKINQEREKLKTEEKEKEIKYWENNKNNIVNKVFPFNVGEDEKGFSYKHKVRIEKVHLMDNGNYRILAYNLVNGRNYDMTTDSNGSVISYTRNDKTFKGDTNDEIVFGATDFVNSLEGKPAETPTPVVEAPTALAPVSDIEAKKADIEKRRQEDLINGQLFLLDDGTNGGSRMVSLNEYSQIQKNQLESDITKWNYQDYNGTGIFVNMSTGQAYIVPNISYKGKKAEVVKVFINKSTKRFDLTDPKIINTPNIELVAKGAKIDAKELYNEVLNAISNYDAELAALEKKPEAPKKPDPNRFKGFKPKNQYRTVGLDKKDRMTDADIQLFKEWHAANASTIPYEVLENIITTNTGEKAWGVFEDNVVKFVKGGLRGTEYHEIGEAIWNGMLTTEEQQAILEQERDRPGTFKDRASGKTYSYDDAKVSDKILKERIMDDFADYRLGKLPARSLGERIRRFFKMIMDFFKTFATKPSLKEELFKAIDTGKFKERELRQPKDNEFAEYRAVEGLTEQQTHEFVQDITARAAGILFTEGDKKLLFNPLSLTADQMFKQIEQEYADEYVNPDDEFSKLDLLGEQAWEELKIKTKQSLRTLGISFSEEDNSDINNDDQTSRDYAAEPFSTDWKKNSSGAIKFSMSTLLETFSTSQEDGSLVLELPLAKTDNSVGGYKLLNFSRAFATVLGKLSNTTSISKMVDKLYDLAFDDPNYVRLFNRVGGKIVKSGDDKKVTKHIPFNEFTNDDWRYFIQFYQTFTKQKPDALIQYKTGNEVYLTPANLFTAIKQTKQGWVENIKAIAKDSNGLIKYNKSDKTFNVNTEKIKEQSIKKPKDQIAFLATIGINFEFDVYTNLKKKQKESFSEAVQAIYTYLGTTPGIMSVTGETLGVDGRFTKLAELYNKVTNPNQESTYFGVENQRIGSFSDSNAPSVFENEFNEAKTLNELLSSRPELHDIFSTNSQILKKGGLFFDKDGNRIKEVKIGYIQGTKELDANKGFKTTKLGLGERFTQEINNNLEGNYYILLPGDSSTEWMMNLGNTILLKNIESGKAVSNINSIFRGYLSDDIALALDSDNRKQLKSVKGKAKELRFFKDILFDKQLEDINDMIEANATQAQIEEYINKKENIGEIDEAIQSYIQNSVKKTKDVLMANSQVYQLGEDLFSYGGIVDSFATKEKFNKNALSEKTLNDVLTFANVNYIINNIEYHKILFGDPYQFAIKGAKLDETKRIKSFLSPRRVTFDSPEYNTYLNETANQVDGIQLSPSDYGYQGFKSYTKTISVKDVKLVGSLANILEAYGNNKDATGDVNEADAASWLMDGTYREIKLKNGQWSDQAEEWHQWQMAFTRQNIPGYKYTNEALRKHDEGLLKTESPKHTIEVLKPIVSGNKYGENKINLVLDKFSQMPIYYSMVKGTSLEKMYVQMFKQNIGYAIVESGRKVGVDSTHSLYNADGSFNQEPFAKNTIVSVPWKSYGIQVETTAEGEKEQTRGSQLVKLASMDLFDNGVPSSPEAKAEYERNTDILNKMHENAYNELLTKLGVEDMDNGFKLVNGKAVSETLMYEMLRRDVSDNTIDAIQLDENDQFRIPFEAAPSYLQIRNIMYSMIDKAILRPKMSGGAHVQVPVTMFESATKGRDLTMKTDKGWVKITKEQYNKLSDDKKKQVVLTDSTLKFYEEKVDKDGKRILPYCEILVPHWFKGKFKDKVKFPNDEAILKYLNSKEGKDILTGIGFRIPTQALSSIEVFKVKGFLPEYMGATVVVPSEITTKAGSDFDIDKLNMYLKSTYVDAKGKVRLVEYKGSEEDTKAFYGKVYDEVNAEPEGKGQIAEMYGDVLRSLYTEEVEEGVVDINREQFTKQMYKRSLENEYYDSLEKLITLPENFDRLISPVDDAGLEELSEKLNSLRGYNENLIKNRILDRNYMTNLRHAFVTAKRWVGIAAVNITNLSLKQKSQVYIDPSRFYLIPNRDASFIGDGKIILNHNTTMVRGKSYISLSGTTVKGSDELISNRLSGYVTAFVDVANKPYITDVVQSDLVVSTFMFLENIGAGEQAAMFLNQPIISEYLKMLDSRGEKSLFTLANVKNIKAKFPATEEQIDNATIDLKMLGSNISYYYEKGYFKSSNDNAVQHKIFDEFLKYAKMAEYAFKFTQATNYDTSSFKNNSVYDRKTWNTDIARESNIISSVDNILGSTFVGVQKRILGKSMQAMGAIFKLEEDAFRTITNKILQPFGENPFMSADDFEKLANKVKADFLDYIIQTKTKVNGRIKELLVDPDTSVAVRLEKAKKKYPDVQILRELQVVSGDRPDGAKSVKLVANIEDAYDNNLYVGMMRELRDYNDELEQLYKDLIYVSILQGTYKSAISIKNVIPIEDYSVIVKPVIISLTDDGSLDAFAEGMFHANNFKNDDVMPEFNPKFFLTSEVPMEQLDSFGNHYADIYQYYSSLFPNIEAFSIRSSERKILLLSEKYNYIAAQKNYIKVPRVVTDYKTGDSIDMKTGLSVTKLDYALRKAKGDYSLNDVYGYARVNYPNTNIPLTTIDKNGETQYVFKLINLYGDGNRSSEFYEDFRPSVLENGSAIMNQIIPNEDIIEYYGGEIAMEDVPLVEAEASENVPEVLSAIDRQINVNQFNITIKPDGKMFYDNGKEVTDQTTINKANIRKELQDGTLRVSVYNNSNYFVLLDNKILGSGATNLGKESISDPKIKEEILAKAITYKKTC